MNLIFVSSPRVHYVLTTNRDKMGTYGSVILKSQITASSKDLEKDLKRKGKGK